jgi:hypothetical protein
MTAATLERETPFAGLVPARGSYKIADNTLIRKGWMVGLDADGRAVAGDTIANGCISIVGKASSTIDNRTGSADFSGLDDATDVFVEYGVFGWQSATAGDAILQANAGAVCFCLDNQTVSLTSDTATLAIAGYVSEVRDGQVYVEMGPTIVGQIIIAAVEASELDTAQTAITEQEVDLGELVTDATTAHAVINIPLTSFLASDGAVLAKFANAGSPTFGFNLADSEALNLRWNNDANPGSALCQLTLPPDLDDTAAAEFEFLCSKSGATVGDATTLTLAVQLLVDGDLHDGDTPVAIVTDALVGNATAKTTKRLTGTLGASDIQPGASTMTFTVTPTAGLLGTDDLMIHSARFRYTRKMLTS